MNTCGKKKARRKEEEAAGIKLQKKMWQNIKRIEMREEGLSIKKSKTAEPRFKSSVCDLLQAKGG